MALAPARSPLRSQKAIVPFLQSASSCSILYRVQVHEMAAGERKTEHARALSGATVGLRSGLFGENLYGCRKEKLCANAS